MISGILLIVMIGSLFGSMTGFLLTKVAANFISGRTTYDTTYTMGSSSNSIGEAVSISYAEPLFTFSAITCVFIILLACAISLLVVRSNLKSEPLKLLSEKIE
jgi:membrane protein YqaA with SNARE-associated domain